MPTVAAAMFTFSLGEDAALLPRTPAIAEAYQELLAANFTRLVRWLPGLDELPTLEQTQADLARRGQAWLDGSQLTPCAGRRRLLPGRRGQLPGAGASAGGVVVVDTPAGAPKEIKLTDDLGTVLGTWTP